jgi:hypothetical protein
MSAFALLKRSRPMTVSAAKLEANRRNSKKSCGPRTEAGKNRSKLNAVTHGMRAETLVLVDEDPQALEERRAAWIDRLLPADDVERRIVEDAVVSTWQLDRARRAQVARLNLNILNHGVDQAQTNEEEVEELGRRLFNDRLGPLTFYPTGCEYDEMDNDIRFKSTSFDDEEHDLDRPGVLVLRLQSTFQGCEWLLGQWAALKAILDRGQPWLPSDKLKAVRLLGRQPFDVIDDSDVAIVFLASFVLKGQKGEWYAEIATEMTDSDLRKFRQNAADRQLDWLKPENATKAREALLGIIERATERLTSKADAHRVRAELQAVLAADLLAFDDSPEGERLRRYELAHGRGVARALDSLHKHRRTANPIDRNVATGAIPESDILEQAQTMAEENTKNEPTGASEIVMNEPSVDCENVTNEPTVGSEIVTNEPTIAGDRCDGERAELRALVDWSDGEHFHGESDLEKASEEIRQEVEPRKAIRADDLPRLNAAIRTEAASVSTIRRDRRGRTGKTHSEAITHEAARSMPFLRNASELVDGARALDEPDQPRVAGQPPNGIAAHAFNCNLRT